MGFLTVYPELLSFPEQVSLFHQADVICGLSGSALHNCVFMRPHTVLIEIADLRSLDATHPMQKVCNELTNVNYHFIPFSGYILHQGNQIGIISHTPLISHIAAILSRLQGGQELTTPFRTSSNSLKRCFTSILMIIKNILRLFKWWLIWNPSQK
jgi:hypothetical protein